MCWSSKVKWNGPSRPSPSAISAAPMPFVRGMRKPASAVAPGATSLFGGKPKTSLSSVPKSLLTGGSSRNGAGRRFSGTCVACKRRVTRRAAARVRDAAQPRAIDEARLRADQNRAQQRAAVGIAGALTPANAAAEAARQQVLLDFSQRQLQAKLRLRLAEVALTAALQTSNEAARESARTARDAAADAADQLNAHQGLFEFLAQSSADLARETNFAIQRQNVLRNGIQAVAGAFQQFALQAATSFRSVNDALRAAGDLARNVINQVLQGLTQLLIVQPLIRALGGALAGAFAGGGGGAVGQPGAGVPAFPGFGQHGGVHRGLTVVGERGPELVDFDRPSRVYPNQALQRALSPSGGGGQRLVLNFAPVITSNDPEAIRSILRNETLPLVRREMVVVVNAGRRQTIRDMDRPGPVRQRVLGR